MKYKYAFLAFFGLFCLTGLASLGYVQSNSEDELKIIVKSSKQSYLTGEVIPLSFELKNESGKDITVMDVFGVGSGFLSVYVSQDNTTFQKYDHGWGQVDFGNSVTLLKANGNVKTSATILHHYKPNGLKGESEEVIKNMSKVTIMTDYAFPKAGIYHVKAQYLALVAGRENGIKIESEPIQITIEEPIGKDLEVWNKIKDNGDIAYFIQEGDFRIPGYKTQEREKLRQEIEQIINQYPNSFYAESLQQSLEKFRAAEEKRQEFLQKLKKEKEKPQ